MEYIVRQARTRDVPEIRALIDQNVGSRRLLDKHTVNLYEDILEFSVSESSDGGASSDAAHCTFCGKTLPSCAPLRLTRACAARASGT